MKESDEEEDRLIYKAPPYLAAEQFENVIEERSIDDVTSVNDMAPPF